MCVACLGVRGCWVCVGVCVGVGCMRRIGVLVAAY